MNVPKPTQGEPMNDGPDFTGLFYAAITIALAVVILRMLAT